MNWFRTIIKVAMAWNTLEKDLDWASGKNTRELQGEYSVKCWEYIKGTSTHVTLRWLTEKRTQPSYAFVLDFYLHIIFKFKLWITHFNESSWWKKLNLPSFPHLDICSLLLLYDPILEAFTELNHQPKTSHFFLPTFSQKGRKKKPTQRNYEEIFN